MPLRRDGPGPHRLRDEVSPCPRGPALGDDAKPCAPWKGAVHGVPADHGARSAGEEAVAEELGLPFECYDYRTPEEIQRGAAL